MDIQEQWRDIPGLEGRYQVSDQGRVMSLAKDVRGRSGCIRHIPQRVLKPQRADNRYLRVGLYLGDGACTIQAIHTLVLRAFVGEPPPEHEACHRDGTRDNNVLSNLYWGTRAQNQQDRVKHG